MGNMPDRLSSAKCRAKKIEKHGERETQWRSRASTLNRIACRNTGRRDFRKRHAVTVEDAAMDQILHVLSVGSMDDGNLVRDALQARRHCRLVVAGGYQELRTIPAERRCEVAILHTSVPSIELRDCCAWIRRTWPQTRILLLANSPGTLDDPRCDARIDRGLTPAELLNIVKSLADQANGSHCGSAERAALRKEEVCGR